MRANSLQHALLNITIEYGPHLQEGVAQGASEGEELKRGTTETHQHLSPFKTIFLVASEVKSIQKAQKKCFLNE